MPKQSGLADLIVKGAITLVTAAFFVGAYLQFQMSFWGAIGAALAVYIVLLTVHALMRRTEREKGTRSRAEPPRARGCSNEGSATGHAWSGQREAAEDGETARQCCSAAACGGRKDVTGHAAARFSHAGWSGDAAVCFGSARDACSATDVCSWHVSGHVRAAACRGQAAAYFPFGIGSRARPERAAPGFASTGCRPSRQLVWRAELVRRAAYSRSANGCRHDVTRRAAARGYAAGADAARLVGPTLSADGIGR
ncbi:MAG: hypothetical protein WDN31_09860 [Hyphomicrobium sp.]